MTKEEALADLWKHSAWFRWLATVIFLTGCLILIADFATTWHHGNLGLALMIAGTGYWCTVWVMMRDAAKRWKEYP